MFMAVLHGIKYKPMITLKREYDSDKATGILTMPDELQQDITSVRGEFAEGIMSGTQPLDGKQLLFINVDATKEQVEGLFVAFDLDWAVLAVEDETVDQDLLLPYFLDVPVFEFDEEGEYIQADAEQVTDLTGKLQVWAGKQWIYS